MSWSSVVAAADGGMRKLSRLSGCLPYYQNWDGEVLYVALGKVNGGGDIFTKGYRAPYAHGAVAQ